MLSSACLLSPLVNEVQRTLIHFTRGVHMLEMNGTFMGKHRSQGRYLLKEDVLNFREKGKVVLLIDFVMDTF